LDRRPVARRNSLDNLAEYVSVQVSASGGPFTEIARFAGPATDAAFGFYNFDITPFLSANTQIRFASPAGGMGGGDQVFFDDVQISSRALRTFADNFNAVSFTNNDGNLIWTAGWTEIGEAGGNIGPAAGDVRVANDGGAVCERRQRLQRQANLTGFTSATLSFLYRRGARRGRVRHGPISNNGGASFTDLARSPTGTTPRSSAVRHLLHRPNTTISSTLPPVVWEPRAFFR
jgi:hypothetical protein